jgi:hypothetical protein
VNDVIQMVKIPSGAIILDVVLATDKIDTGTSAVLQVGDGSDVSRFINSGSFNNNSYIGRMNQVDGHLYEYSADDTIDIKVTTAPETAVSTATLTLTVFYCFDK